MNFRRTIKHRRDVNLIPLINVIFLMLIFFMVAGTVEKIDIFEVDVPVANSGYDKSHKPATVYLSADGRMAVNDDIVAKEDIKTIIKTVLIDNPAKEITVKADAKVEAASLIWIMNIIEDLGGRNISLVTQKVK